MQAGTNNFTYRGGIYFTQRGDKYGDYDVNGHMEQVDVNEENIFANEILLINIITYPCV